MSSLSVREFAAIGLDERVPEAAKVVGNAIPVQSIITNRRQQKFLPVNGSTFTPNQNPNFRMSATSDFLIPSSATLHFKLVNKTTESDGTTASTTACFDDPPALAVIQRAILRASGVLVEDILETNRSAAALSYTHMDPERYAKQGSIDTKNWKWNRDYETDSQTVGAPGGTYAQAEALAVRNLVQGMRLDEGGVVRRQALASAEYANDTEIEVNLPLSYVFGLFRTNRLFPLSFVGELNIELTLAQAITAIVSSESTDIANYEIRDTYIVADMAVLSDDYLKVLSQAFSSPDPGMAYNLPVDTLTNITQNKAVTADSNSTLNSYVYSKSTPFLRSIMFTTQDNTARSSVDEYAVSGMPNFLDDTNSQVRMFIGSEVYPQYSVLDSTEEVARNNQIGLGTQGNVRAQYGLVSHENYKNRTTAGGINHILFSFAKVNGLGPEAYDMDSMDASLLGSVIDLQMNQVGDEVATSCSTLAMIEHTRVCRIGGGRFEVKA